MTRIKTAVSLAALLTISACQSEPAQQYPNVTIYPAKTVVTMTGEGETATAVAVKANKIVGVGNLESLTAEFSGAQTDETFKGKTIMPGLIDPHMHVLLGGLFYAQPFAPPWPMAMPDGYTEGYDNRAKFLKRLKDIVAETPDSRDVIMVYGYHNLVQGPLYKQVLDQVTDRPLIVWHYSGHDFYLNSAAIDFIGATPALAETYHGVDLNGDGELTGRIYEDAAFAVFDKVSPHVFRPQDIARGLSKYFAIMRNAGITSTAELGYGIFGREREDAVIAGLWSKEKNAFNLYLIPEHRAFSREFGESAAEMVKAMSDGDHPTPAPVLPRVKFFTDGAFYSQTMRLSPPGYLTGQSKGTEGLWVTKPGQLFPNMKPYLDQGLAAHVHSNGDAAQGETLKAFKQARDAGFENDFVIEHAALFNREHVNLAKQTGTMISAASHYVHYMGHTYEPTLGDERSKWLHPMAALNWPYYEYRVKYTKEEIERLKKDEKMIEIMKAEGPGFIIGTEITRTKKMDRPIPITLHSDAPLAPPQPLVAAGRHVTRTTKEGHTFIESEVLGRYDALEAITLDAATVLGLEDKIGSIEIGKTADFTVLDLNPLKVKPEDWGKIDIWGVVLDGELRPIE